MPGTADSVERHYARRDLLRSIDSALAAAGKDLERLAPEDLAPVDAFHIRGREATLELARLAAPAPGTRVLDVGCGLGGSARHLAAAHGCIVTGIDLTAEYIDVARNLTERVGLGDRVQFRQASALDLPFADAAFDVVWTEHTQMNIADKRAFYAEIARVLAPNGRLAFHDVFAGEGGEPYFPAPWAEDRSISHLVPPESVRELLEALGFSIRDWADKTSASRDSFAAAVRKLHASGPPGLGLHLLMGSNAAIKVENTLRNLTEKRVCVVQAIARKEKG
jgi:ubiquinone/menaquinone biosynthesis C-methylase UbiE